MKIGRPTKPRVSVNCWSHYHRDCVQKNWCTCACHVEPKTVNVGPPQLTASCLDCRTRTELKDYGLLGHSAPDGRACPSRRHRPGSIRVVAS